VNSLFRGGKHSILDFAYYLFMGTVPIEVLGTMYYDLGVSLSFLSGVFFVFCYFLLNKGSNSVNWPPLMGIPFIWLMINIAHYLGVDSMQSFGVLSGVLNNLIFSVILYNYLLRRKNIKSGLLVMALATGFFGLALLAGQGFNILAGGRFSILDFDENNIGSILAFGSLILIMFAQERTCNAKWSIVQIVLAILTLSVVVATGSRGAMLSLILTLFFYLIVFFSKKIFRTKSLLIILFVVAFSIYFYQLSPTSSERWQATLQGQSDDWLGGRDVIFAETLRMISEKPILGWGLLQTNQELGQRIRGSAIGTHNTYFMIFVTTGIAGGLPFMVFFLYPFAKLKEQRGNDLYIQLIVLLVFVMLVFMSLDWLNRKQLWIIYSMLLAHLTIQRNAMSMNSTKQEVEF